MQGLFTADAASSDDIGRLPTEVGVAQIAGEDEDEEPAAGEAMESSSFSCSSSSS